MSPKQLRGLDEDEFMEIERKNFELKRVPQFDFNAV